MSMIHFLGTWHGDPFWMENTTRLVNKHTEAGCGTPAVVGLEYSEAVHSSLVELRPAVRGELMRSLPWLDTKLIDAFASALGWEPEYARARWPETRLAWLDDDSVEEDPSEFPKTRVKIHRDDLERAGVTPGLDYEDARRRLLEFGREKSRQVAAKDPAVVGLGPVYDWDRRDTRMFRALQEALKELKKPWEVVILVGAQHLIPDERTLLSYCKEAGYGVTAYWLHDVD